MSALDWTPRPFPPATVLQGRWCRLEPLDPARHLDDIWQAMAGHASVWDWLPSTPPPSREAYGELLTMMAGKAGIVPFAVIDEADGKAKGHLWMMEIRPEHGVFEVGWITYSPSMQRTRMATEAVYLVGDYGFSLGYRRYEWKCNNRNEPSKRAALRFGFQYEGLFRQHMVVKGENRDTAWYSILDGEWQKIGDAFRAWLVPENFDAQGRQKTSLAACMKTAGSTGTPLRRATTDDIPAIVALTEAAYLPNESTIGVPSLPRIADYDEVLAEHEVWLSESDGTLDGVLVLEEEPAKFTLWSIAVSPAATGRKIGSQLMSFAEERARALGHDAVHLYTHVKLADRIGWYERLGYQTTHYEDLPDRRLIHMRKSLR